MGTGLDVENSRPAARWSVRADRWGDLPAEVAALLAPPIVVSAEPLGAEPPRAVAPEQPAAVPPVVVEPAACVELPRQPDRTGEPPVRFLAPALPRAGRHRRPAGRTGRRARPVETA